MAKKSAGEKNTKDLSFDLYGANLTLEEVCNKIDDVIKEYMKDRRKLYYGIMLDEKGLYKTKRKYWADNYQEVSDRIKFLKDIAEGKYNNALVSGVGAELNATNLIFYGKTTLKRMEEYNRQRLENEKKELDLYEKEITIGFDDEEE